MPRPVEDRSPLTTIATVLLPSERAQVDAAGEGLYHTVHRNNLDDVLEDLKQQRVTAVVISAGRCTDEIASRIARMVREFPRIPAVALLTQLETHTAHAVLSLGYSGIRTLVDVRNSNGWRELRDFLLADGMSELEHKALGILALDLAGAPTDCWEFFEVLFTSRPQIATVRMLAVRLQVVPSTLMSRFFRARLPAPKRYLAFARLTQAARLFENPGVSVASVANHLEYSSPQSFGRHIRTMLGMTAVEFRRSYTADAMIQRFREELVLPFQTTLRDFSPLAVPSL